MNQTKPEYEVLAEEPFTKEEMEELRIAMDYRVTRLYEMKDTSGWLDSTKKRAQKLRKKVLAKHIVMGMNKEVA